MVRPLLLTTALFALSPVGPGSACTAQEAALPTPRPAPAPTPEAVQVRAIQPPREPLPAEADSAAVTRFSFLAYGDTRGRRDGRAVQYEHSLVVDSMLATIQRLRGTEFPVRFVVQTGDAVVDGRDARQWNESFVALIDRITTEGGVPYFLAPGNHDVTGAPTIDAPQRQTGLANYLDAVARLIPPAGASRRLDGYPTYAFGYGNLFAIALDSNIASDSRQLEWVRAQLAGLDRGRYPHVVVVLHHPPFSSGPHGGSLVEPAAAALRERYMPLFREHGVAVVFAGHEHFFEHWVERWQDAGGHPRRLDHVTTGGGGAPLYASLGAPDLTAYLAAGAAQKLSLEHLVRPGPERGDSPYHYLVVTVDGAHLALEIVGIDWGRAFAPYRSRTTSLR